MLKSGITKTSRECVAAYLTWSVLYRDLLASLDFTETSSRELLTGFACPSI